MHTIPAAIENVTASYMGKSHTLPVDVVGRRHSIDQSSDLLLDRLSFTFERGHGVCRRVWAPAAYPPSGGGSVGPETGGGRRTRLTPPTAAADRYFFFGVG